MVSSPAFRRIEQRLSDPAGATLGRHGQILDPGSLPKPYRDNVEIDRRESDDRLIFISHQNGRPIIGNGCLEPLSCEIGRPISWPYPGSGQQPFVGCGESPRFTRSRLPDPDVRGLFASRSQ
jgi:hypothetical protein